MFDHVIVDEASQLDMSSMSMIYPTFSASASLAVVGDDKQMPPIFQADLPVNAESVFGSVFSFYADFWNIQKSMLQMNYRSNEAIVNFCKNAGYGSNFRSFNPDTKISLVKPPTEKVPAWLDLVLDADKPLICIIHDDNLSPQQSQVETELTTQIVNSLRGNLAPDQNSSAYSDEDLFSRGLGIVTPHVAQKASIYTSLMGSSITPSYAAQTLHEAIDTVERFQGQEKDVILISYALSDKDSIEQEEEFIFGLERFNVAVSRAKHKVIVLLSRELVKHIPKDIEVVEASRLLKLFASRHLKNSEEFAFSNSSSKVNLEIKY